MLEQVEYIKKWALQDNDCLTKDQILKSIVQMCDDILLESQSPTPIGAAADTCPACHGERFRCVSGMWHPCEECNNDG